MESYVKLDLNISITFFPTKEAHISNYFLPIK